MYQLPVVCRYLPFICRYLVQTYDDFCTFGYFLREQISKYRRTSVAYAPRSRLGTQTGDKTR